MEANDTKYEKKSDGAIVASKKGLIILVLLIENTMLKIENSNL